MQLSKKVRFVTIAFLREKIVLKGNFSTFHSTSSKFKTSHFLRRRCHAVRNPIPAVAEEDLRGRDRQVSIFSLFYSFDQLFSEFVRVC